jgi:predicted TIM-barrel fold metal-dependent hydrolase
MNSAPFTNTHLHVFNADCVPKNFLRILPNKQLRKMAPHILKLVNSWAGRKLIFFLARRGANKDPILRKSVDKYLAFLTIALHRTQQEIFEIDYQISRAEDSEARLVALTLNMDHMDETVPRINYQTQLEEVRDIKRYYPDSFFPFYSLDPRHLSGEKGLRAIQKEMTHVVLSHGKLLPYFCGFKLYPALGFFPFDRKLLPIYAFAEKNHLPILSHCTRVGTQYIGKNIEGLIPLTLELIYPEKTEDPLLNGTDQATRLALEKRITNYYNRGWVKNSKIGDNDYACDLFGHPQNYIPLLLRFPKLKICLAHMGGSTEIDNSDADESLNAIRQPDCDPQLWFDRIIEMMIQYENLYTDISYTLSSFAENNQIVFTKTLVLMQTKDRFGKELAYRVLFGTDFFMTEQEMREAELIALAKSKFGSLRSAAGDNYWQLITKTNPTRFLAL